MLALSIALQFVFDPRPLLPVYAMVVVAAVVTTRIEPRTLLLGQLPFVTFGVGLIMINALSRPGRVLMPESPIRITAEGLTIGVALALRALIIGVATIAFLVATAPRALMLSLIKDVRLSPRYGYAILAGHRMLESMPSRWATIRAAQSVRAPLTRSGRPTFGPQDFARAAFVLLVASIRSAERIASALESRGLRDTRRTRWRP